ncbi:MAG: hypothetical protein ICV68_05325 [Pyrinomonadaceae bacterium]|nr:hypothetical protein [Pyrinomonadaceae bacterium]
MQNEKLFHIYEGFFGGILFRDGFGLQGEGRLFINGEQGTIEISAERPLPFSRLFRTLHRPPTTYTFPANQIKDLTQQGRVIQFRAPKNNGKLKQTKFTAQAEAEAQEIYNVINSLNLEPAAFTKNLPR